MCDASLGVRYKHAVRDPFTGDGNPVIILAVKGTIGVIYSSFLTVNLIRPQVISQMVSHSRVRLIGTLESHHIGYL